MSLPNHYYNKIMINKALLANPINTYNNTRKFKLINKLLIEIASKDLDEDFMVLSHFHKWLLAHVISSSMRHDFLIFNNNNK